MSRLIRFLAVLIIVTALTLISSQIIHAVGRNEIPTSVSHPEVVIETALEEKPTIEPLEAPQHIEAEAIETVVETPVVQATYTGDKYIWLAASGIPESEWWAVDSIVSRESSWNPNAVNPSSGACGLGQQLPCGKWPGAWNDPIAALKAQYNYVTVRYGGYPQAVAFWNSHHWY